MSVALPGGIVSIGLGCANCAHSNGEYSRRPNMFSKPNTPPSHFLLSVLWLAHSVIFSPGGFRILVMIAAAALFARPMLFSPG